MTECGLLSMAQRILGERHGYHAGDSHSPPHQSTKSLKERACDPPLLTELEDFVACELANINRFFFCTLSTIISSNINAIHSSYSHLLKYRCPSFITVCQPS